MSKWFQPQVLEGQFVRLEPLEKRHYSLILESLEPDIFTYMNLDPLRNPESLKNGTVLDEISLIRIPLITINLSDGNVAGSSSFYVIREDSQTIEVGGTWVKKAYQGTKVNTEAKYLMFKHGFEVWKTIRIQIRTHNKNEQSKRSIEKLGLVKEGVIRNESVFHDGSYRDTALYSVINSEWAETKSLLEQQLYSS
ncbi:MAG: GNAT family protein [Deinococcota bacterium]